MNRNADAILEQAIDAAAVLERVSDVFDDSVSSALPIRHVTTSSCRASRPARPG